MKVITRYTILAVTALLLILQACKPDPSFTPDVQQDISFKVPDGWPAPVYNFENNKLTKEGFELGKKLFFDTRLSIDNSVSCGSCHLPGNAFAQIDHDLSHGVNDKLGTRNSPAIFNMNWHTGFFWDGGVNHIENQPINPIENPVEMAETMQGVIAKLNADATYKSMFKAAFGDETVNSQRIGKAFAQFMGMLVSSTSKYDDVMRGAAQFTVAERKGLDIFKANCATCHKEPLFSDFSYRSNGLSANAHNDSGRGHITGLQEDMKKFKVPSLRNLSYTRPYMHDGRMESLTDVLEYYSAQIDSNAMNLDPMLKRGIPLTAQEKDDLLSFLKTLDDPAFVRDPRFQEK
ncbi:MAG: c-type cytochrome [Sphingobacteriales bacterium]|nr:MAG: c-type cytochrome [Sphingobacteriales bacterium]